MKTKHFPLDQAGNPITDPRAGFIVVGSIYVAQVGENGAPEGGLIGDGSSGRTQAYNLVEFMTGLGLDRADLIKLADKMPGRREDGIRPVREF